LSNEAGSCGTPFSVPAAGFVMHPMEKDVLAVWTAPADGAVNVTGRLWDADTSCGNGIDWRLALLPLNSGPAYIELDRGDLDNGGGPAMIDNSRASNVNVVSGDRIAFNLGDRGNTNCDLTNVELSIASTTAPAYTYVAMGDSYSSGEGSPEDTFFHDTVRPDTESGGSTGCHRSSIGWPTTVAASRRIDGPQWKFAACSGAKAYEFYQRNDTNKGERPQLVHLSRSTKLVTFTIGGNDVGFADVLKDCVYDSFGKGENDPGCGVPERKAYDTAEAGLGTLAREGRQAKVMLATKVADEFNAHSLCGKKVAYFNGTVLNGTRTSPDQRSFHPSKRGQGAYAKAVKVTANG
jgi:hypothetical protein